MTDLLPNSLCQSTLNSPLTSPSRPSLFPPCQPIRPAPCPPLAPIPEPIPDPGTGHPPAPQGVIPAPAGGRQHRPRSTGSTPIFGRRIWLAPGPGRPGGPGLSRGGEPVHRGGHAADRGAAGAAVRGDAGADQGDRPLGPRAASTTGSTTRAPRPGRSTRSTAAAASPKDRPKQVLLDLNPLAEGQSYFRLGAFEVSPDHRLLAWSSDTSGAESFTLRIKDLATGEMLEERIGNLSASVRLGQRQPHAVLRRARRRAPALQPVPPPPRRRSGARRAGVLRGGRVVLPRRRPHPEPRPTCCSS